MTVETRLLVWLNDGLGMCSRSTAMRLSAVLSSTTTASALSVRRLSVSTLLYGCTTTSLVSFWLGNTLHARRGALLLPPFSQATALRPGSLSERAAAAPAAARLIALQGPLWRLPDGWLMQLAQSWVAALPRA